MDVVNVVSAVAAAGSAMLSLYGAWKTTVAANKQQRVAVHAAVADWRRDLREWASESVDALSEAAYACRDGSPSDPDTARRLASCHYRVSSLIDRGRFFLPNQDTNKRGVDKPFAYRGSRHATLDPLVAADRVLRGELGAFSSKDDALIEMKRHFVSAIQKILAPDVHNQDIAMMIREGSARATDPTLGGLLPDEKALPPGADPFLFGKATP